MTDPHIRTPTTSQDSRQVAEVAREEGWERASFMRELFDGRFRLGIGVFPTTERQVDRQTGERGSQGMKGRI